MAVASYFDTVQKLYIAFYQRPADPSGLYYWAQRMDVAGGSLEGVIDAFASSEEAVRLYDTNADGKIDSADTSKLLDDVYKALFDRAPDAAGKQFYVDALAAGKFPDGRPATIGRVVLDVLNGANNADAVAVANKLEYATAFTKTLDPELDGIGPFTATYNGDDEAGARTLLAGVTADPTTRKTAAQVAGDVQTQIANAGDPILNQQTTGQTFTLTAGVNNFTGTAGDDTFDASLQNGAQTLGSADQIDGGNGVDTLYAVLSSSVTPAKLANIEDVRFTSTAGATLDLVNATGVTTVTSQGSTGGAVTITNIAASTGVTVQDSAAAHTINYTGVTGSADAATVSFINSTGGLAAAGIETLTLKAAGGINSTAVTAVNATKLNLIGSGAQTVTFAGGTNPTTIDASTATGNVTVTAGAATNQTITGGDGNDVIDGNGNADVVSGGKGNDAFVVTTEAQAQALVSVNGGEGTDVLRTSGNITDAAFATPARFTSVEGVQIADGTAIDVTLGAQATTAGINTVNFNTTAGSNGGNGANVVDVTLLGLGANVMTGAGDDTVRINIDANADSINTAAATGTEAALDTNASTGDDLINITNTAATQIRLTFTSAEVGNASVNDGGTLTNQDGGLAVRIQRENAAGDLVGDVSRADDEGVSFRSTNTATFDVRDLPTGTARGTFGTVDLGTQGDDKIVAVAANSAGGYVNAGAGNDLLGGSASADFLVGGDGNDNIQLVTVADGGTANAASTVGGNDTVLAGLGNDTVVAGTATGNLVIDGGDGNDNITTGSGRDSITGGAGNDTIVGGGANDTITGGDGNDRIDVSGGAGTVNVDAGAGDDRVNVGTFLAGSTATTRDTILGGDGTDTLVIGGAVTSDDLTSVTGFERLEVTHFDTAGTPLNTALFGNLEQITVSGTGANATLAFSNTAANFTQLNITGQLAGGNDDITARRLVDNSSNALTINVAGAAAGQTVAAGALDVQDEETLTILSGAATATPAVAPGAVTLNSFASINAADATSLTISGNQNLQTGTITALNLATINASALTGATTTLNVDASTSTVNLTFTGGTNEGNTTVVAGAGNDTITAGSGAIRAEGNNGNDSITGGGGADTLLGGAGNDTLLGNAGTDSIDGGNGADSIVAGAGADTVNGGAGDDQIDLTEATSAADVVIINGGESVQGVVTGQGNDIGGDTLTAFSFTADTLRVVATAIAGNFAHGTNTTIGTAGASSAFDAAAFATNVGLVDIGANGNFNDALDVAVTFAGGIPATAGSITGAEAVFESRLQYNLTGDNNANTFTGGALADTLNGGGGADVLTGAAGADTLNGDAGTDTFVYAAITDLFTGNALVDSINGGTEDDTIRVDADGFTITAADSWARSQGVDILSANTATANAISITLNADAFTAGIRTVTLAADTNAAGSNTINGSNAVTGQNLALTGSTGIDSITGGGGTDFINGGGAADVIDGGAGADIIIGGAGADNITGNAGTDSIRYLVLGDAGDTVVGFAAGDVFAFDVTDFAVAGLTSAAAGDISTAAAPGTTLAAADYFEFNTSLAGAPADIGDLSGVNVFVLGETAGTFASSTAAMTALATYNTNTDAPTTAMLVVYATAAGAYTISYDSNGATAGGETVIATLTGIADGAAALAAFSAASFAFGA